MDSAQKILGIKKYYKGDYSEAHDLLLPLAEKGDAKAQYYCALTYFKKGNDPRYFGNISGAQPTVKMMTLQYFLKAAEQGYAHAQYHLGIIFLLGMNIVPKNETTALEWFHKAAQQGLAVAQFQLGRLYAQGLGTIKNTRQSFYWLQQAAQQGLPIAQRALGLYYFFGIGTSANRTKAAQWFIKSVYFSVLQMVLRREHKPFN